MSIPGLYIINNFIEQDEEQHLINFIDSQEWNTSLQRRTQHYGYTYSYGSNATLTPTTPIPR